jgi:hypothetical protein
MSWLDQTLDQLSQRPAIGYMSGGTPAAEPTALAAIALLVHNRSDAARNLADALVGMQDTSGEVGVRQGEPTPGWPTSLAIASWCAIAREAFRARVDRAVTWLLANRGKAIPRSTDFGHNTELVGWAYAENTHSWVEPTSFATLALRAAGKTDDPAAREATALLIDRQLPGGGLNYGNTMVLGQFIRPHIEPTGIALLALSGQSDASGRLAKSIAWLRRAIGPETTALSLSWALLGLRAHGTEVPQAGDWLENSAARVNQRDRSPHKLALLALAAQGWPT